MDIDVIERARKVEPPIVHSESPAPGSGGAEPSGGRHTPRDEWRWIPDPAEAGIPLPPPRREGAFSEEVIKALTQLGLQYWR
jgi:hypothetical protein